MDSEQKKNQTPTIKNPTFLFNPKLLRSLKWEKIKYLKGGLRLDEEGWLKGGGFGQNFLLRPLKFDDFGKGYLTMYQANVKDVTQEQFETRFESMRLSNEYYILVVEDTRHDLVVAAATLSVEQKFVEHCGLRGRTHDVVVRKEYQGKQLGKLVVCGTILLSEQLGTYKIGVACKTPLQEFYKNVGFEEIPGNEILMEIYFTI